MKTFEVEIEIDDFAIVVQKQSVPDRLTVALKAVWQGEVYDAPFVRRLPLTHF